MKLPPLFAASLLLLGWLTLPALAQTPLATPTPAHFANEIAAFERQDATNPPPKGAILFVGSSSIRLWTNLAQDFPEHRVLNRGFGGSMISDSIAFADRIVIPYAPRLIVLYAGGNDINAGKSPETVAEDFRTFAEKVRASLPETDLDYLSIAPNPKRWSQIEKIRTANALIRALCEGKPHLRYIDVHSAMLGSDGRPKEGIYRDDQLHMNLEGYKIWTAILRPLLPQPDPKSSTR